MKKALKFLKKYKGKDADMKIEKKLASMEDANSLILEAHKAWKEHVKPIVVVNSNRIVNSSSKIRVIRG